MIIEFLLENDIMRKDKDDNLSMTRNGMKMCSEKSIYRIWKPTVEKPMELGEAMLWIKKNLQKSK